MIIDSLANSARYESLNPYFKQAFDFLKKTDLTALPTGKHVLVEDKLFINVSDGPLKDKADAKLEIHNKYIDIQVPISGDEGYGWKPRRECTEVAVPYNPEKEAGFYADPSKMYFTLPKGDFVIFFPEDGHAPTIGTGNLKKLIVKVII